jgi:hypothetical protein
VRTFSRRHHGWRHFPYDTLYVALLIGQAFAMAVWVACSPLY